MACSEEGGGGGGGGVRVQLLAFTLEFLGRMNGSLQLLAREKEFITRTCTKVYTVKLVLSDRMWAKKKWSLYRGGLLKGG